MRAPWVAALGLLALGCEGQVVAGSERRPGPRMENPDGATFVPPTEDAGVRADGDAGGNPVVGPSLGPAPGEVPVVAPSTQYAYTPAGCAYPVTTQTVTEAGPHVDAHGDGARFVDHLHLSYAGDASSSFAVNWRSDSDSREAVVIFGTDAAAVAAQSAPVVTDAVSWRWGHSMLVAGTRLHEVHVCGLSPNSTYYYKVGGGGVWSEVHPVSTAPAPGASSPIRFAVFGDSRGLNGDVWPTIVRESGDFGADFALTTGDAVEAGTNQSQWNAFFEAAVDGFAVQDGLAELPFMVANGNHDALALNFVTQFAMPQEVSAGEGANGEEWYSFDYGPVHVVVLNDTASSGTIAAEAAWLESDLQKVDRKKTPWVFAAHHRPPYTCNSAHSAATDLRATWQPIYDAHGVDIVFNGHNHEYERTKPIRGLSGGNGVAAPAGQNGVPLPGQNGVASGTIYLLTGGASASLYNADSSCALSQAAMSVYHYVEVQIDGVSIDVRVVNAVTGGVVDAFAYTKSAP